MKHTIAIDIDHTPTVPEPATFDDAMRAMDAAHDRQDPREHWILFATHASDVFGYNYIGYWAQGFPVAPGVFVVWESDEGPAHAADVMIARDKAERNQPLSGRWHRLDRAVAGRAYDLACARWGVGWYGEADAHHYDVALQLALLGEVTYG